MVEIIPAILSSDPKEVEEKLKRCENVVERVQIDIIDGQFVDNRTIDPSVLENYETDLKLDFHLMVKEPVHWVERSGRAGADRIIAQIEEMSEQALFVGKVEEIGAGVGLALNLDTPVSDIDPGILASLDVVLVMAVAAGFGGQKFNPKVLGKIKELDEIRTTLGSDFKICVDGGETEDVIDESHFAGADEIVIGKKIFKGDLIQNIKRFQKSAHGIK